MSHKSIRVGVVGVGAMGRNHLRIYDLLKGADLVAIVDPDLERAGQLAAQYGCRAYGRVEDLVGKVDAVSVVSPSTTHAEIATYLLDNGIHCLVEKPLATTEEGGRAIIAAAERSGCVLLVGHVERYNPAIQQLADIIGGGVKIHAVDARRMSAVSARIQDVDVVADLMVHDLDIVLALVGEQVSRVRAAGVGTGGAGGGDYVTALLSFASGSLASLTASRITQNKIRELHLTTDQGFFSVNYVTQSLSIFQQGGAKDQPYKATQRGSYVLDIAMERVLVRAAEPLMLELQNFLDAINGTARPIVTGPQALDALRLVWQIQGHVAGSAERG